MENTRDMVEINQLIYKYSHYLDQAKTEEIVELFHQEASLIAKYENNTVHKGKDAIRKWYEKYLDSSVKTSTHRRHKVNCVMLNVKGNEAEAFSYLDADGINIADNTLRQYVGSYADKFIKKDKLWYFQERIISLEYSLVVPGFKKARNF